MRTVHKYPLRVAERQTIEMPEGARLLSAQPQDLVKTGPDKAVASVALWALVDTNRKPSPRHIVTVGTGDRIDGDVPETFVFVSTFQIGSTVRHVFEAIPVPLYPQTGLVHTEAGPTQTSGQGPTLPDPWPEIQAFVRNRPRYAHGLGSLAHETSGQGHTQATMKLAAEIGAVVVFDSRIAADAVGETYPSVATYSLDDMARPYGHRSAALRNTRGPILFDNGTWATIGAALNQAVHLLVLADQAVTYGWGQYKGPLAQSAAGAADGSPTPASETEDS